nr:tubulin-specific chaperone a [Quercus suber]
MAPPTQLAIATSSLTRLVKEEASYHQELAQQQVRITKLESGAGGGPEEDENAEYNLRQERRALEETEAVFPQMKLKIQDALANLQHQLDQATGNSPEEITKAKEAAAAGLQAVQESS